VSVGHFVTKKKNAYNFLQYNMFILTD